MFVPRPAPTSEDDCWLVTYVHEIRAGLHTGECEVIGDKLGGIAVHIGARVAALASPGEVLVSSTVKDLVAGSGLRFQERGVHLLWGGPESDNSLPCNQWSSGPLLPRSAHPISRICIR
jgi:hypothetical protein